MSHQPPSDDTHTERPRDARGLGDTSTGDRVADTSDTSLLPQPTVRELVLAALSPTDRSILLAGGTPRHERSSSSGPLRPDVELRRREVLVTQYTPAAWRSHAAWHTYWRERDYDTVDEEHRKEAPPTPRSDHRKVRLTWTEIRSWLKEGEEGTSGPPSGDTSPPPDSAGVSDMSAGTAAADAGTPQPVARRRTAAARDTSTGRGLPSRDRHRLDRAAQLLRVRYAHRPSPRSLPSERWRWSDARAQGCEASIRELLAELARSRARRDTSSSSLEQRAHRLLELADQLLATTGDGSPGPPGGCAWCAGAIPAGLRPDARFCSKRCRQASSRFALGMQRVPGAQATRRPAIASPTAATRRPRPRKASSDRSPPMRLCYADPPYPGKASYYPEQQEVDHAQLVSRLTRDFPDGWALSTCAAALREILAACPAEVRVCSWHRAVRPTTSRRPISAWEPLIVYRGRELPLDEPQIIRDALTYEGRYRSYPGALIGMKPPQFAIWLFAQLGARAGDELVDLYPSSGAVTEAWRRYTATAHAAQAV
jgi:hypothetical protein